jgi:hypothetical protein
MPVEHRRGWEPSENNLHDFRRACPHHAPLP